MFQITAKHINDLLSNSRDNIISLSKPDSKDREKGFAVLQRLKKPQYIIGDVGIGTQNSIFGAGIYDFGINEGDGSDSYFLFTFHSHHDGDIAPSYDSDDCDFFGLCATRWRYLVENKISIKPIEGIVGVSNNNNINVLLLQEKTTFLMSETDLGDNAAILGNLGYRGPKDVERIINDTGLYNALHFEFNYKQKLDVSLSDLKKFEFNPEFGR